jgi:hypothetical protein
MFKTLPAGLALCSLLLLTSPASAHFGAVPEALSVFVAADPGSDSIALEASFGLLLNADLSDDNSRFHWLCHENIINIGATVTPRYTMNSEGVLLGTTGVLNSSREATETLYRSTDNCNWETTSGLTGTVVTDMAFSSVNPQRAIASTATLQSGAVNGLFYSDDAGASWQASDTTSTQRLFRNVYFGDDGTAWATSSYFNPLSSWLYRSDDGGLTWSEIEIVYEAKGARQVLLEVVIATGSGPQVWLRIDAPIMDRMLYSSDGGNSFTEIFEVTTDIKTGTRAGDGRLWLVDAYGRLLHADGAGTFELTEGGPSSSGTTSDARGLFISARVQNEDYALLLSPDGGTYQGLFVLEDVAPPPTCEPTSHSAQRCEPYWEALYTSLNGDDDDSAGDDDDSAGDDDGSPGDDDDDDDGDDDDSAAEGNTGCCASNENSNAGASLAFLALLVSLGSLRRRTPHTA